MSDPIEREMAVFNAARRLPAGERAKYLDEACAGDAALRQRFEELLQASEEAGAFLQDPAPGAQRPADASLSINTPASAAAPGEKVGDRIGRYKLLQQIGQGGCGVVYMAEQEQPVRRQVALKVIKLGMDTKQVVARFEAERQALALMDHPNIAKVLEAGATETGRPYFVMELVRGIKITHYCDENNLPTRARLDLFIKVAQAVQHAHQKGIMHRDLKPSNILVADHDGVPVPKVIDFGIAKATTEQRLTDKTLFTAFEQFIGTPAYMSPEQARMSGLDIDTRTDIYSLGVLLYELLTGKTPFDAQDLLAAGLDEMRRTIREKEPARPSTRLSTMLEGEQTTTAKHRHTDAPKLIHLLRGDLDWIVMKALEKDRTRRYETANGLAMDIARHLNNELVFARPPSALYRFQKSVRRNKTAFAAATAIAAVLVLGVVVSTWQAVRATHATQEQTRLLHIAETKEKKSEQIALFLKDMLKGVGPSVALGRDTTMLREILDQTAERVGKDLANQPEVEVELCLTLAGTYHDMGLYKEMEGVARHSLQLARTKLGEENESVARSLITLGVALTHAGQTRLGDLHFEKLQASEIDRRQHDPTLAEAENYCRKGLAMTRKLLGDENSQVANGRWRLASVLAMQYRMAEAESMHRETLAMYRKLVGNEHAIVGKVLYELASFLAYQEKSLVEAESLNREALAIQRRRLGQGHPEIAASLYTLAIVSSLQGRWPEGETLFREVVAMRRKLQANERPGFASALHSLGYVLMQQGKLAEAESQFREALALRRKLLGNEHPDVADSLHKLAVIIMRQGRAAEAEELCREELVMQRKLYANDRVELATALNNLGYVLMHQDKLAEAESLLREAVEMHSRIPDEHVERTLSLNNLAKVLQLEGKLAESETRFREALELRRKRAGNEHPGVADSLHKLAIVVMEQGRLAEAEGICREELSMRRKLHTNDSIELATALNNLGYVLLKQKKLAEAETMLRETVAMKRRLPAEHAERTLSLNNLAEVFQLEGKLTESETIYREALARQRKQHGNDHLEVAGALSNLGYVLTRQSKLAEARPLADEAVAICLRHPDQAGFSEVVDALRPLLTDLDDAGALGKLDLLRQRNATPLPSAPPEPQAK